MRKVELFTVPMHAATLAETVTFIDERMRRRQFTQHVVVNVAKLVHMQADAALRASVIACDIINVDGMGVVWGARFLGLSIPERVPGIDLFEHLLALAAQRGYPIFLLGARQEVVERVARVCARRHHGLNIAGFHHGYFWDDEDALVRKIRQSGARMLFVAVTSPLKENFINKWKHVLGVDFVMGVGGTFDVIAGGVRRAPRWAQAAGMEWLFRLVQEPRRMWRRYLTTNVQFAWMLLKARAPLARRR